MDRNTVVVKQIDHYETPDLTQAIQNFLDSMTEGLYVRGEKVLLKPNFLSPATVETAILTHPQILRIVAEYFIKKGALVQISDSPAMGSFRRVLKTGGYIETLKGLPVQFSEFKESISVDVGKPFGKIELARDVFEASLIVNLPKLKTHTQMLLTLAVKNLFGTVVGVRKPEWHLRTGVDREQFARLLVRIASKINPQINILDGVVALEGQGPGKRGTPRAIGVIMASGSAFSIDWAVCKMIGLAPERLPTLRVALEEGSLKEPPVIDGPLPEVRNFRLPEISSLIFGPSSIRPLLRRHLTQKPVVETQKCTLCKNCINICPAKAIGPGEKAVKFDYDLCIRCYCCVEVCPEGALYTHEPLLGKMIKRFF